MISASALVSSDALLCTVTALNATSKTKTITLHDPDIDVELKFAGTMCVHLTVACLTAVRLDIRLRIGRSNGPSPGSSKSNRHHGLFMMTHSTNR